MGNQYFNKVVVGYNPIDNQITKSEAIETICGMVLIILSRSNI